MSDTRDNAVAMVTEFMDTFEPPRTEEFWLKLIKEEKAEVHEAAVHLLKELADLQYVVAGLIGSVGEARAEELLTPVFAPNMDHLSDLYEAFGDRGEEAFRRVHISNMSKVGDDGKPIRREDGKILKGPNYKPPVLDDLILI